MSGRLAPVVALACAACGTDIDERESAAETARTAEMSGGVTARVAGATVRDFDSPDSEAAGRIEIRAQSFDLRFELEVTHCEPRTLEVVVAPVGAGARLSIRPFLAALAPAVEAAREAGSAGVGLVGDRDDPDWTPVDGERAFGCVPEAGRLIYTLHLNPQGVRTFDVTCGPAPEAPPIGAAPVACLSVGSDAVGALGEAPFVLRQRVRAALPDDGFEFAVIGNNAGVGSVRDRFLGAVAAEPDLAFVIVNGDLTSEGAQDELDEARAAYDRLPVPWFATLGDRDVEEPEPEQLVEAFGAPSFAFDAGPLRLVLVDSADAGVSATTYDLLDAWLEPESPLWWPSQLGPPARIVFTHFPPFEPSSLGSNAFKSRREAARFVAALRRADVLQLVTAHLAIFETQRVAGVEVVHSGGGGAPMETIRGDAHHWLRVTVTRTTEGGVAVSSAPVDL